MQPFIEVPRDCTFEPSVQSSGARAEPFLVCTTDVMSEIQISSAPVIINLKVPRFWFQKIRIFRAVAVVLIKEAQKCGDFICWR